MKARPGECELNSHVDEISVDVKGSGGWEEIGSKLGLRIGLFSILREGTLYTGV